MILNVISKNNFINYLKFNNLVWIVFFVLSSYLIWVVGSMSSNLPFSDQIDIFFGYLKNQDAVTLFLQQHGPHRQGLGAIVMSHTLSLMNWNFSVISYITAVAMILSAYIFMLSNERYSISWIVRIAIISLLLSLGSGELLTVTPNISHSSLPILFSFIIFYLIIKGGAVSEKKQIIIVLVAVVSLFTGFGVFLFLAYLAVLTLMLLNQLFFRGESSIKIIVCYVVIYIVMALSASIFFMNYSSSTAEGCAPSAIHNLWNVLIYSFNVTSIIYGGSNLGGLSAPIGFFQVLLFAVISVVCAFRLVKTGDGFAAGVLVLTLVSMSFILNVAVGRHCLGGDSAFASRYYPLSSLGVIGVLLAIDRYLQGTFSLISKVLATSVFVLNISIVFPSGMNLMQGFYSHKNNFLLCMKDSRSLNLCNELYNLYPNSERLQIFSDLVQSTRRNQ